MTKQTHMAVRFWGVRGSVPTPDSRFAHYGGHTSCVEIRCGQRTLILDAGTGLIELGNQLAASECDILLSHTHLDHIHGLLFFKPAYDASKRVRLWAGHLLPDYSLKNTISQLMQPPIFPLTTQHFGERTEFIDFHAGELLQHNDFSDHGIVVKTLPLSHPDRATGYRVEYQGHAVCYITDIEHTPGTMDAALLSFIAGADCLIYDSTYTDEELPHYKGWGHSTWQQGMRLAQMAGVKQFVAFHHDPAANDAMLDQRAQEMQQSWAEAIVAKEGMELVFA